MGEISGVGSPFRAFPFSASVLGKFTLLSGLVYKFFNTGIPSFSFETLFWSFKIRIASIENDPLFQNFPLRLGGTSIMEIEDLASVSV